MTQTTPTYGYDKDGNAKLFELEDGQKLPSGYHESPKAAADFSDGFVDQPDSTSRKPVPAPEVAPMERVADPTQNNNDGPVNYTPTTYPHVPGDSDIHPDDENHDGIDRKLGPDETFNRPIVPRDGKEGDDDELTEIAGAEDKERLFAYAKKKDVKLDKRQSFSSMLDDFRAQQAR
jgi:hypothetical protein